MFSSAVWSLLFLSSTSWVVLCQSEGQELNTCPTECQCTTMNKVYMYCGFAGGLKRLMIFPSFIPIQAEILSLRMNLLTEIPESALRNLTCLTTLNLRSNKLRDLPATVFRDLSSLKSLNAGFNKLSSPPGRLFQGLNALQELYLDNNAIERIPDELFQDLPSLKRLHLHHNKLKTFSGNAFRGTFSLQDLSLANNQLTAIHERTFANLTALKRLTLTDNRIVTISANLLRELGALAILRLERNNISSISERAFAGLKTGIVAHLRRNPFYCDCKLRWLKGWLKSKTKYIHYFASRTTCFQPDHLKGKPILNVADKQFTCVDGQWTEWSPWNSCSRTCGRGMQVSTRHCTNPPPGRGGEKCKGNHIKTKSCDGPDCGASWTAWSEWSECSKTCFSGIEARTRSCQHSLTGLISDSCIGSPQERRICTREPCSIDGVWSSWSKWSSCSVTCSWGTRLRTRICDNPPPRYGGQPCFGRGIATEICYLGSCPVHGGWSTWSSWSSCSASCSSGTTTRYRNCSQPVPRYGGDLCDGDSIQQEHCQSGPCPINGGWASWSNWSMCSVTCSRGSQLRLRICNNPIPQHGGQNCPGNFSDLRHCDLGPCPIHGNWTAWSQWSDCSKTCANGTRSRNRTCNSPVPQFGGRNCSGKVTEIKSCIKAPCPIPGKWATWSQWSECSKSCSSGRKSRRRTCDNPSPSHGGPTCTGRATETEMCQLIPCPIDGQWGEWSNWTDCSKTCSEGIQSRYRNCNNPPSQHGGKPCSGNSNQSKHCNQQPCSIRGEWTEWSNWTDCSKTCDAGQQKRTRLCLKSVGQGSDILSCAGNETDMRVCFQGPCSNQGKWTGWSSWSQCSVSCGLGKQERIKNCSRNRDLRTEFCLGPLMQVKSCYQNCTVSGGWSDWSNWTACSSSCGNGIQAKFRLCNNPKPQAGGDSCSGKNVMFKSCVIAKCRDESHQNDSFWTQWTSWSHCSATCSGGFQTRSRYCRRRLSPFHLGNCTGNKGPIQVDSNICEVQPCAEWSSWSTWETCSETCGGGTQKRVRKCQGSIADVDCQGENSQTVSCNTEPCPTIYLITYPPRITLRPSNPCPDPEKPDNGYYKKLEQYGSYYVTHYCRRHYYVHGPRLRHCESDGTWSDDVPYCLPICGESSSSFDNVQYQRLRIFGGGTSLPGLWPWQVALTVDDLFHCGGSLIAENWVVTAAHCVYNRRTRKLFSHIRVHLGVHDIKSGLREPFVQSIDSKEIVPHPNFNWNTFDSDLALIQLKWKVNITDHVRPVCLPSKQQRRKVTTGAMGVMLGWGLTEGEKPKTELQQVYMPVVGHSNCQRAYKRETWPVTSNMLCAGYASNIKDSCKQDSGGGFLFPDSKGKRKKWFLGGIISWGNPQCGTPGKYSVFTHINSRFSRWIKNHVHYS